MTLRLSFEDSARRRLAAVPVIHDAAALLYQAVASALPGKPETIRPTVVVRHPRLFFGFHDRSPWNRTSSLLLAHRYMEGADFRAAPTVEVGVLDGHRGPFAPIGVTHDWNWQQGAMLQWLGGTTAAFNTTHQGQPITRAVTSTGTVDVEGHSACATPDGQTLVGYSFSRLLVGAPEYGYWYHRRAAVELHPCPADDGLFLSDWKAGRRTCACALAELAAEVSAEDAFHFVTHATTSADGRFVAFFHRWRRTGQRLRTRLVLLDRASSRRIVAPIAAPSHYCWDGDRHLIVTDSDSGGAVYQSWQIGADSATAVLPAVLVVDGHPQVNPTNPHLLLTDTYPDARRTQSLLLVDRLSGTVSTLFREHIPIRFRRAVRCDFHPRWSPDGRHICLDSAGDGTRSLVLFRLEECETASS